MPNRFYTKRLVLLHNMFTPGSFATTELLQQNPFTAENLSYKEAFRGKQVPDPPRTKKHILKRRNFFPPCSAAP